MVAIPKVHRVKADDLKVGQVVEQREHPWASPRTARKIARDHLQENPKAYSNMGQCGGGSDVNVTLAQNVKAMPLRKKKKPAQAPANKMPSWIRY